LRTIGILEAGPLATIQDQGRFGFRDRGVPVSGAMDVQALEVGNLLVGNDAGAAAVEITLGGFKAEFLCDARFAVTGADQAPTLNGVPVLNWACHPAAKGDVLHLDYALSGMRACLALSGGVDVPEVMGSRSTYLRGGFGGHQGRALRKGDVLMLGNTAGKPIFAFPAGLVPPYSDGPTLRVIPGPQDDHVTEEGMERFLGSIYEVTARADRMGISLSGPLIELAGGADIISDGTCAGAVQVHGNQQPTVLAADGQTTGGYVKIATVISADLPLLAQISAGAAVRFAAIGLLQAREIYLKNRYQLRSFYERYGSAT
jgi:biotin-dependent carboxylase-like uncharacterized protein